MNRQTDSKDASDPVSSSTPGPLAGYRTALTLLMLAYTLSMCDRMILSILFPDIKAEFGLTDTQLGLLGGISFALFYAVMGLPIARLSDQYSRKWIIVASLVVFSLMTVFSGVAAGFISLLILRIGVGIGEAGVNPASHSIIADYFPPRRRAFAMAILMLGASLGMMLGFVGGGFIAEAYSWRIALVSVGVPGLLMAGVFGISGAIGALVAGRWFDRLSSRGFQYGMWMLALVPFVTIPFFIAGLLAENLVTAILLFIIPGFAANYVIGPAIAMVQTLAPVQMRAVSSAIKMLCLNLIGMGLGPLLVGLLSDLLTPKHGEDALSIALAYFTLVGLWGSLHFWLCGRALAKQQANRKQGI